MIASQGTGDGGSSTKGTPCLYLHGTQGATAVKLGAPWLEKEDSAAGRYFHKPL